VVAQIPGDEGKGVSLMDHGERLRESLQPRLVDIEGNLLADGTGRHAGSDETVEKREKPIGMDASFSPELLLKLRGGKRRLGRCARFLGVDAAGEGLPCIRLALPIGGMPRRDVGELIQPAIASRL
jgi:hypothetical protein